MLCLNAEFIKNTVTECAHLILFANCSCQIFSCDMHVAQDKHKTACNQSLNCTAQCTPTKLLTATFQWHCARHDTIRYEPI